MYNKIDGAQKTSIIIITLFMAFIYILISLPSENVGVYMHAVLHEWAVLDSNSVALENEDGYTINEKRAYHCVLMERSNGGDNHIQSFTDFDEAFALYSVLQQLEINNSKLQEPQSVSRSIFLIVSIAILCGLIFILVSAIYPNKMIKIVEFLGKMLDEK